MISSGNFFVCLCFIVINFLYRKRKNYEAKETNKYAFHKKSQGMTLDMHISRTE